MKNTFLTILVSIASASGSVAFAGTNDRPDSGRLVQVHIDNFKKLAWSKALPGRYTNGCVNAHGNFDYSKCVVEKGSDGRLQVKVEYSAAAHACKSLGARLPTELEFNSLIRNFDHIETTSMPRLTSKGIEEMQLVFGDMNEKNNWFWTSSVTSYDNVDGILFSTNIGSISGQLVPRGTNLAVRCVADL
jgi:hypothetical protein